MKINITQTNKHHRTLTITLYTAREMYNYYEVTHEHSEYNTEWGDFMEEIVETFPTIHISLQSPSEQPENGDVIRAIVIYSLDEKILDDLEINITSRLLTVLSETYPWDPTGEILKDIENESDQSKADDLINQYE
tara:strand:+ start:595 stop:999 length:405 start_codon:yes stop_codon:yes gene_type:complete